MNKMLSTFALCLVLVAPAFASTLSYGGYLGTFNGNDNTGSIAAALGIDETAVNFVGSVEWPGMTDSVLTISNLTLNGDGEATAGQWAASGLVDLIVLKSGPQFAIYLYDPAVSSGLWDTSELNNKGLSHISAYQIQPIPLPAAGWLLLSGVAGLGLMRRRK